MKKNGETFLIDVSHTSWLMNGEPIFCTIIRDVSRRKKAENELVKTEERFINIITKSAVERYHYLLNNQPEIISRIQLSYIASYIGIAQASLSRIRNMI